MFRILTLICTIASRSAAFIIIIIITFELTNFQPSVFSYDVRNRRRKCQWYLRHIERFIS